MESSDLEAPYEGEMPESRGSGGLGAQVEGNRTWQYLSNM